MKGIYLLLGSNLGDRWRNLEIARELIQSRCGVLVKSSTVYETAAWGIQDQRAFLNQVIEIESDLEPSTLIREVLRIEMDMGRKRFIKWGERLIDIDMLYYGSQVISNPDLKVPHPELQNRLFTLIPLVEIAPDLIHPVLGVSQEELLKKTPDALNVIPYSPEIRPEN